MKLISQTRESYNNQTQHCLCFQFSKSVLYLYVCIYGLSVLTRADRQVDEPTSVLYLYRTFVSMVCPLGHVPTVMLTRTMRSEPTSVLYLYRTFVVYSESVGPRAGRQVDEYHAFRAYLCPIPVPYLCSL